jgi:hypothetical protein
VRLEKRLAKGSLKSSARKVSGPDRRSLFFALLGVDESRKTCTEERVHLDLPWHRLNTVGFRLVVIEGFCTQRDRPPTC